jgi:hypothetical protein
MSQGDSTREVRAMVLLSMPCPPMPMIMSKEMLDEVSYVQTENVAGNSHDLIAHFLNKAAAAGCRPEVHKNRQKLQQVASEFLNGRPTP